MSHLDDANTEVWMNIAKRKRAKLIKADEWFNCEIELTDAIQACHNEDCSHLIAMGVGALVAKMGDKF